MGSADTFTVVLDVQPASDVVISVTSADTGEATVMSSLIFTSANWDTAQTSTVIGVNAGLVNGTQMTTITLTINDIIQTTILTFWLVRRYLRRQRMVIPQGLLLLSRVGLLE